MPESYTFGPEAVAQIRAVVSEVLGNVRIPVPNAGRQPMPSRVLQLGKTTASITKGASGTVRFYAGSGSKGSEEPFLDADGVSFVEQTAYNRLADIGADVWVWCVYDGGGWELLSGECT